VQSRNHTLLLLYPCQIGSSPSWKTGDNATKERTKQGPSNFSTTKRQKYDWENDNLEHNEGLIESDIAHPDIPAEFPGIDLESEQPHHHQVVDAIKESDNKRIYAAQRSASLDNLPLKPTGVSTAVDKVELVEDKEYNWEDNDTYHDAPVHTHDLDNGDGDEVPTDVDATKLNDLEEAVLASTTIDGLRCSTQNWIPTRLTKVNFDKKTYSDGQY
jgi:hypothetical protein